MTPDAKTRLQAAATIAAGLVGNHFFTEKADGTEHPDRFTAAVAVATKMVRQLESRLGSN